MSEPPGAAVSATEAPPWTDSPSKPLAAQRVLPPRRPGRWIATAGVLVLAAQFVHGLATNPFSSSSPAASCSPTVLLVRSPGTAREAGVL